MSVTAFLAKNSVLWPLIAVVGAGVGGSLGFGAYYLSHNSDVVVNKKIRDPWNNVAQDKNSKLLSYNGDFWKSRVGMPDPRRAFLDEIEHKPVAQRTQGEKSYLARAREMGMTKAEE
ncbi:hypothetical protein P389DRAFT_208362 [Cystobasidium minutum MCA 4210]|uniref:uncharacterized protein n=1 Tax=Cystobasidium minutum MCA 4210 TaxID=1397322 RepID=UPI0034CFD6DE|eukprot:jgi/Rhomi1/208362/estExt_Genemark1.C_2_t10018